MLDKNDGSKRFFARYTVFDLIMIAMLSALSIAVKAIAGILVRLITGPLGIPGGALAGGFYMLWLPISIAIVRKRGAAFLVSLVQTLVLLVTSAPGSHGVWSFLTYLIPAIFVELVFLIDYKKPYTLLHFVAATLLSNILGTYGSNLLFFRLSVYPLLFTLVCAGFSGAVGGAIGYYTFKKVEKSNILPKFNSKLQKGGKIKLEKEDISPFSENPLEKDKEENELNEKILEEKNEKTL